MTSLDCFDLQQCLATAKASWCKIAVLETSSQWLDQYRFEWIKFDFAVLTNITMDHLDYHKTMENYAKAKKKLFRYVLTNWKDKKYASFCTDDKIGKKWFEEMAFDQKVSYSIHNSAVIKATKIEEWLEWTYFEFSYLWQKFSGVTQLIWSYNICNIMWAISVAVSLGLPMDPILKSVEDFSGVAWRMEPIYTEWVKYYIDFAHTPDWLEKTLSFANTNKWEWKLIAIVWAPGNRDKEKRPIMWDIAVKYADVIVFTDDDPDTENRLSILNQLSKAIQQKWYPKNKKVFIIPERKYALQFASEIAKKWDVVVSCWKWHEQVQITNFGKRKRSDKGILSDILTSQKKLILNSKEIKKAYLENLKYEKSQHHITTKQYYSDIDEITTDKPSWMFKRID
jgi:UDP-N-acetylmuramoyl-L-alanyl-D-glutamate--2,6-diaminopimelate ligase